MKRVKVVIPVYAETLTENEWLSLRHNAEVLSRYPIAVLLPRSLPVEAVAERFPEVRSCEVIRVSDGFLGRSGILGYNRMMLSAEFYEQFSDCEYILICQTDAWIFRDELEAWCSRGYDYVGGTWWRTGVWSWPVIRHFFPRNRKLYGKVGNGGLSLRRVESFRRACCELAGRIAYYLERSDHHIYFEDVFWAIEPRDFRYPSMREAIDFSFDNHPDRCLAVTGGRLPFGCHGWLKPRRIGFWEPFIPHSFLPSGDGSGGRTPGERPAVSVIIPVYNLAPYIGACLASVAAQTFGDFEAVVVDDGSTDDSLFLIRSYAAFDGRIRVVATPNQGVAQARKEGIARASGRYICFLDGDDMWEPDILKNLVEAIGRNGGCDIVCCNYKRVRASYESPVREIRTADMSGFDFLEATLSHTIAANVWGRIYRREFFDAQLHHYPLPLGEDTLINIQIGCRRPRVRFIDYVGYGYRQRSGSANRSGLTVEYCECFAGIVSEILSRCPGLSEDQQVFFPLLSRVRWYLVYINKSRSPWAGNTGYARQIHALAGQYGARLRQYYRRGDLLLLRLDRSKWLRSAAVALATLMRWDKSLHRRMAH